MIGCPRPPITLPRCEASQSDEQYEAEWSLVQEKHLEHMTDAAHSTSLYQKNIGARTAPSGVPSTVEPPREPWMCTAHLRDGSGRLCGKRRPPSSDTRAISARPYDWFSAVQAMALGGILLSYARQMTVAFFFRHAHRTGHVGRSCMLGTRAPRTSQEMNDISGSKPRPQSSSLDS